MLDFYVGVTETCLTPKHQWAWSKLWWTSDVDWNLKKVSGGLLAQKEWDEEQQACDASFFSPPKKWCKKLRRICVWFHEIHESTPQNGRFSLNWSERSLQFGIFNLAPFRSNDNIFTQRLISAHCTFFRGPGNHWLYNWSSTMSMCGEKIKRFLQYCLDGTITHQTCITPPKRMYKTI